MTTNQEATNESLSLKESNPSRWSGRSLGRGAGNAWPEGHTSPPARCHRCIVGREVRWLEFFCFFFGHQHTLKITSYRLKPSITSVNNNNNNRNRNNNININKSISTGTCSSTVTPTSSQSSRVMFQEGSSHHVSQLVRAPTTDL